MSFCLRFAPLHSTRTPILFTVIARSARLNISGLETFAFLLRQILRTPRFCLRPKSLRSYARFPSSESQKTPAGVCPRPHRENDRHGTPHHSYHRPTSFPRDNITVRCVRESNTLRRQSAVSRRLAIMGFLQGLTASKSVRKPRTFGVHNVKGVPLMNVKG